VVGLDREAREAGRTGRNKGKNINNSKKGGKAKNGNGKRNKNRGGEAKRKQKKKKNGGGERNGNGKRNKKTERKAGERKGKRNKTNGKTGRKQLNKIKKQANPNTATCVIPNDKACDLFQMVRSFSVARTQFIRVRRINTTAIRMSAKASASATIFQEIAGVLAAATSDGTACPGNTSALGEAAATLKTLNNCSVTVPTFCNVAKTDFTAFEANLTYCGPELANFQALFKACFFDSAQPDKVCECLTQNGAIALEVELNNRACLPNTFKTLDIQVKNQNKKCIKVSSRPIHPTL
jgi:hypothetical protein